MKAYYVRFVRGTMTRTNWFWDYQAAMAWLTLEIGRSCASNLPKTRMNPSAPTCPAAGCWR